MNTHEFYMGQAFDAYEFFGAHVTKEGVLFRTYAPNARRIQVIGEFNEWQGHEMYQDGRSGIFSCCVPEAKIGMLYKYKVFGADGSEIDHCDPYGFEMQLRPESASVIRDLSGYQFEDETWMKKRGYRFDAPVNIYEMHLGSWRRKKGGESEEGTWYTYSEIAEELIAYVKENNYNYIEFMPLSEHPADVSWGYQNTGFFAPTSRYGTALELKELVDKCHQAGIGVIMDFVPVHFAVDAYGLANYDGTSLYEYPNQDVGVSEWGSYNFIHSRGEVRSFLQSAANYWLSEYHFDGIRMDAISRIIYWQGTPERGVNGNAVDFIKVMNQGLKARHPGILLMAEDSTDFLKVTAPVEYEGLGFDFKWDMGWMNDTLDYFKKTPEERAAQYYKLSFSMMYFYNEHYLLPLSHDEVVHGKATIVQKMYGDYEDKFRQARAFYLYMYAHPGKKLNFMGNEIGQLREWDEKREQDWEMLKYPMHDAFHHYMRELNRIYLENNALYDGDYNSQHFRWIYCRQEGNCVYAFERKGSKQRVMAVFNFSDREEKAFAIPVEDKVKCKLLLHSEWEEWNGSVKKESVSFKSKKKKGQESLVLDIPAYSAMLFELE